MSCQNVCPDFSRVIGYNYITLHYMKLSEIFKFLGSGCSIKNYSIAKSTFFCGTAVASPASKWKFLHSKPANFIVTEKVRVITCNKLFSLIHSLFIFKFLFWKFPDVVTARVSGTVYDSIKSNFPSVRVCSVE